MIVDVARRNNMIFLYGAVVESALSGRSSSGTRLDNPSSVEMWLEVKNYLTVASMVSNFNEGNA